ncbi:MAG: hypothetical protein HYS13_17675 [Planctomycetia bacterium]|nr:hypothetical protein [Planctomycetia bacterium]
MTHDDFIAQIDRFLDGDLDVIEWHEFRDHMNTCRDCSQRLVQRRIELLEDRGILVALLEPQPQRCITAGTLTRWLKGEIPMELSPRVSNHLRNCRYCHDHAAELAARLKKDNYANANR